MSARFADTSYFLALLLPNDKHHQIALTSAAGWRGNSVTTDFVLIEVANFLCHHSTKPRFAKFRLAVEKDPRMKIVKTSAEWVENGIALFESGLDKDWSLTDCISFIVMKEMGLTEALTADHHFAQAGFTALMK